MTFPSNTCAEDENYPSRPSINAPEWSRFALERIKFERRPGGGFGLKMPGGYWVTEATLRNAFKLFWRSVRGLDKAATHTAEDLACTSDWATRPKGQRIAMGRCFKYFALHRVLPVTIVNPEAKYNFKYRLNDNLDQAPTIH